MEEEEIKNNGRISIKSSGPKSLKKEKSKKRSLKIDKNSEVQDI